MSNNTLEVAYTNGQVIDASHINELTLALLNDLVGRNTSGVPTVGKNLGTLAIPWGNIYASGIVLNGSSLDLSQVTSLANRIVSGKTRSLSSQPDFITPNGAALSFILKGLTTNLTLSVNNIATVVSTDITKTGITAAPSTTNTCLVNDTTMVNDKYAGEDGTEIIVDAMGANVSSQVGQVVAFKNGTEIMMGYLKSTILITDVYRGFFFDSAGAPLVRANLSNNDVLTIMKLGWVFVENNGTTVDVSYTTPITSYSAPLSPVTGDYWFDISNQVWKRYSGTSFDIINRILVGVVVSDATNTIAARSFDFYKGFSEENNVDVEIFSTEIIRSKSLKARVNVYGTEIQTENTLLAWNITTNLESPLTEAISTTYYLYLSDKGQTVMAIEKPYDRKDLKGLYHPYHTWRCIGYGHNNASSNLDNTNVLPITSVTASYYLSANFAASTTIPVNFDSKEDDSHNAVVPSPTVWKFTAPVSGKYSFKGYWLPIGTSTGAMLYKNGILYKFMNFATSSSGSAFISEIRLKKGEYADLRPESAITITGGALTASLATRIDIARVGNY